MPKMKEKTLFDLVAEATQKENVPSLLIGGFAVNYHGIMRQTQDVDFLMMEKDYDKIRPFLEKSGCHEVVRNNLFARLENRETLPSELDIMFVVQETLKGMLDEAEITEIKGKKFKVASLDHLLALKLHAMKQNIRRRGFRDLTDVLDLAERNQIDTKSKKFEDLCLKYGGEEIYRMIKELLKK